MTFKTQRFIIEIYQLKISYDGYILCNLKLHKMQFWSNFKDRTLDTEENKLFKIWIINNILIPSAAIVPKRLIEARPKPRIKNLLQMKTTVWAKFFPWYLFVLGSMPN